MSTTITRTGANRWEVPSASQPEPRLVVRHAGALTCDCPAGFHRGRCRHITQVAAAIEAEAQATWRTEPEACQRAALRAEGVALLAPTRRDPRIDLFDGSWEGTR